MTNFIRNLSAAALLVLAHAAARAAVTPLSVNIVPPVQFPSEDANVAGLRLSAGWGEQRSVYGVDAGLLGNITNQDFGGVALAGVFNITRGSTTVLGLQLAGLWNSNAQKTRVIGLQVALGLNRNVAESSVAGLQFAAVNLAGFTDIYGVQAGIYNEAQEVYGLQIGLINRAKNLHGIQIGLANFNDAGPFKISPLLNVGF